jgi:hypothetical protein
MGRIMGRKIKQLKTFQQWRKDGFTVAYGEKSKVRSQITGEALFSEQQVCEIKDDEHLNTWSIVNGY